MFFLDVDGKLLEQVCLPFIVVLDAAEMSAVEHFAIFDFVCVNKYIDTYVCVLVVRACVIVTPFFKLEHKTCCQ